MAALSLQSNFASLVAQNTLTNTNSMVEQAMLRLSTGYKINSAADDAAGLQISNRLELQTRGMKVAERNANDGISLLQTAEGAFDEMTNIAYRINDLATQAANGINGPDDFLAIDAEVSQLVEQLRQTYDTTNFGGVNLFSQGVATNDGGIFGGNGPVPLPIPPGGTGTATPGDVVFQIGSTTEETLRFNAATEVDNVDQVITDLANITISDQATAQDVMDLVQGTNGQGNNGPLANLVGDLGAVRAEFGATINRLDSTIKNLQNMGENISASKGRITDADFAVETANLTKNQLLMQAGTQVLGQVNQLPGLALSLLR
ncbi:Lateral flagellin [Paraphotobacterium marinum]|uniref:Flagellin n=1 Tax=Paraphotobacterium marinum TaxID=1755811 RepID=A0A220VBF1_9GAMM|nr:flagellin [Paraphotobacterium marinum]ASK77610.1 Lateral flagellin [Paraphotobacterium marinum]